MCALLDSDQFSSYIIHPGSGIVPLKESFYHLFPTCDRTYGFHARADHMEFLQVIVRIFICQPSEFRKQMDQARLQFKRSLKSSSSNTQWGLLYRWSIKLL
ncbi:uncharacterized protein G2W53_041027 [Senna tora]|uniref:Uncharacterized protein n=1 Tax=Senna tora TaxID=362788 RepID=A0A834SEG8_9FABA|nr:uncharacterized protein G2W53_041027 [Senna tora]